MLSKITEITYKIYKFNSTPLTSSFKNCIQIRKKYNKNCGAQYKQIFVQDKNSQNSAAAERTETICMVWCLCFMARARVQTDAAVYCICMHAHFTRKTSKQQQITLKKNSAPQLCLNFLLLLLYK